MNRAGRASPYPAHKNPLKMENVIERAKRLEAVSEMADTALAAGVIDKDQHAGIKSRARDLELENLFRAMADFCNQ